MKRLVAAIACGALLATVYPADATAQTQKAAPDAAKPVPAKSRPARHAKRQKWARADARVCLEFPTNLQVIRCAEKYRYMRVPA